MLSVLLATALAAQAGGNAATVTFDQIGTLPPEELGRRLLDVPRPAIVQAYFYNEALSAPPPPGEPTVLRVMMYAAARESSEPGFCEKVRYLVRLKPVIAGPDGTLPPSSTATIAPDTLYRWASEPGAGPRCEGPGSDFLSVSDGAAPLVFAMIRLLADAQRVARHGGTLDFVGSVDDRYGATGQPDAGKAGPIRDWKEALRVFPTTRIGSYSFAEEADGYTATFRAGDWTARVTQKHGGGIGRIAFSRVLPSPP